MVNAAEFFTCSVLSIPFFNSREVNSVQDQRTLPSVELDNNMIRIADTSGREGFGTIAFPVEVVDEFCEAVYLARKEYLTRLNDSWRAAEGDQSATRGSLTESSEKSIAE